MLPDYLKEGLDVIVVGTSVGEESAARGHYYAGPGNKAYQFMHAAGLTGEQVLRPEEDFLLPSFGVGLTDLVKARASSSDGNLTRRDCDISSFIAKIQKCRPFVVAFNGRTAARHVATALAHHPPELGPASWTIGDSLVYVLPSSSGSSANPRDFAPKTSKEEWWKEFGLWLRARRKARASRQPKPQRQKKPSESFKTLDGVALVLRAVQFAARKHKDQRRKDANASPYINHPIAVANVLSDEGDVNDSYVLAAALLHDTMEDTETSFEELRGKFGDTVAQIVAELTDTKWLEKKSRKRLQISKAARASYGAKLVKLGDKICNLRDIIASPPADWSVARKREYFDWAKRVIDEVRGTSQKLERRFDNLYRQRP